MTETPPPARVFLFPGVSPTLCRDLRRELAHAGAVLVEGLQLVPTAEVGVIDLCEARHPISGGRTGWQLLRNSGSRCEHLLVIGGSGPVPPDIAARVVVLPSDATSGAVAAVIRRLTRAHRRDHRQAA